jgi:hypothetical protein
MTPWERLKSKLAGKAPIVETPAIDWQAVKLAQQKRLYNGWKANHIQLIRSGKFPEGK